jgi:aminotransferase
MINVFQPTVGDEELAAIQSVFATSWLGRGQEVAAFERELADYFGVDTTTVLTTTSCTEAMFQVLDLVGVPGGNVVLPTVSFVGAANAIQANGMTINFCDVDAKTGNPDLQNVVEAIDANTVAVLVQHLGGVPCDIAAIAEYCKSRGIILIEDSAGSIATRVGGRSCGTFGDFGVWSFDAMKMVVGGDGGAIYCRDLEVKGVLQERLYLGMSAVSGTAQALVNDRWWEFDVTHPSRRSIMNDVSAAMARVQLRRLASNVAVRRRNHEVLAQGLSDLSPGLQTPDTTPVGFEHSYYFFPILVADGRRDALAHHLRNDGIYSTFRYFPLHLVGLYGHTGEVFAGAQEFADRMLLLPQHASLSEEDLHRIVTSVHEFFGV